MNHPGTTECRVISTYPDEQVPLELDAIQDVRYHELLNSNEPPLDAELPFIESVVLRHRSRLSNHDDKILRLRAQLERLEQERTPLEADLLRNTAILSPMRRMPPEILAQIFALTLPSDRKVVESGRIDVQDSPWILTRVCGRWRTVAIASSFLWSFLSINCDVMVNLSAAYPLPLLTAHLQRANYLRIHFLAGDCLTQYSTTMLQLLVEYSPRCEELYLFVIPDVLPIIAHLHDRIPLLRKLWLEFSEDENLAVREDIDSFCVAPALRDVSLPLQDPKLTVHFPAHRLTRYELNGSWEHHIAILKVATHLIEARICVHEETSLPAPGVIIELCDLRRLHVSQADILNFLRLPALQELGFYLGDSGFDVTPHIDLIVERSSCILRRLCVEGVPIANTVTGILRNHQAIVELVVILLDDGSSIEADTLITDLSGHNVEGVFNVAPQLNGVFFGCQNDNSFDCKLYHDMLLSRWKAGALKSAVLIFDSESGLESSINQSLDDLRADGLNLLCIVGNDVEALTMMWAWTLDTYL
jgi:hypothetical protein